MKTPPFFLVALCLCGILSGCGGGGGKSITDTNLFTQDFIAPAGHFRGVMYASATPAAGEPPLFLLDFVQHNGTDTIPYPYNDPTLSTYQSPDGKVKGLISNLFAYATNNKIPLVTFTLSETERNGQLINSPLNFSLPPDAGASTGTYYPAFGPPTNNGTHFEGYLRNLNYYNTYTEANVPRYKVVLDLVP